MKFLLGILLGKAIFNNKGEGKPTSFTSLEIICMLIIIVMLMFMLPKLLNDWIYYETESVTTELLIVDKYIEDNKTYIVKYDYNGTIIEDEVYKQEYEETNVGKTVEKEVVIKTGRSLKQGEINYSVY